MKKIVVSGLITGVALLILSLVFTVASGIIFPELTREYAEGSFFRPWSDPLMLLIFIHPFVLSLALAYFWSLVKESFPKKEGMNRGLHFGFMFWIVASVPGMLISYSSFTVSGLMIGSWTLSGLFQAIVAGWILARLMP